MKLLLAFILIFLVFGIANLLAINFSGQGAGLTKGDERQKDIFRDATTSSWRLIILYAVIRLFTIIPFVKDFTHENNSLILSNPFFKNGGDILLVALFGYLLGFTSSYLKKS